MGELHRVGVVHRDLAARNVMLDKWFQAKVGDFGLAREGNEYAVEPTDEDGNRKKLELPWKWVAPEAALHRSFNQASDVWAFGITLWEIFTFGGMPYPSLNYSTFCLSQLQIFEKGYDFEWLIKILKCSSNTVLAMTNQDTLREIQRGYRLEKPHYPGSDATDDQLKGIYGVKKQSFCT